jgi:CubicO group peptidase (beta-lactamase class C family)
LNHLSRLPIIRRTRCEIPADLGAVTSRGVEAAPEIVGCTKSEIEGLWSKVETLYRSGTHPAVQLCIRREGEVAIHRAIGHAAGNAPDDAADAEKRVVGLETPICLFSASKAITAMVVHKLAEQNRLHLDDAVCDFVPEFGRHGKHRVTLRHVLSHRAGLPNLPAKALDLDLLSDPGEVLEVLCDMQLQSRPGRVLAYHAITGGFILREVVERATGLDLRDVLREEIAEPLGLGQFSYGVAPEDVDAVAVNASTGPAPPPPLSQLLRRALGRDLRDVVALSNDPRFLTGVVPSANVVSTAWDMCSFYQCLLDHGTFQGRRVFAPRTLRHAIAEQSFWEMDFTLFFPLRYSLGFMLGNERIGPFGSDNPHAFGHVGLSNIFCWADPDRSLSVALLTTGKPLASLHVVALFDLIAEIGRVFPKLPGASDA